VPNLIEKNSISSELAQRMVDAALVKATAIGVAENVAVVDDGGNLKAFARMDGAPILSIEISQHKAYTAPRLDSPSSRDEPLLTSSVAYAIDRAFGSLVTSTTALERR
jgi:uncharacterized protein GlcG (DUF336 family)